MSEHQFGSLPNIPDREGSVSQRHYRQGSITPDKLSGVLGLLAAGTIPVNRFVESDRTLAETAADAIMGVSAVAMVSGDPLLLQAGPVVLVESDSLVAIAAGDPVMAGSSGKAALLVEEATELEDVIDGGAASFSQAALPDNVQVHGAADVAGDRGRVVVVVGTDAGDAWQIEEITLDAEDSSTVVVGTLVFKTVLGAYMQDGEVVGAQDIEIEDDGTNTDICVISAAAASVGVKVPNVTTVNGRKLQFMADEQENTFILVEGYKTSAPTTLTGEVYTFDNAATNSFATSTTRWHQLTRLYTGGFGDGVASDLNALADGAAQRVGIALTAAAAGERVAIAFARNYANNEDLLALLSAIPTVDPTDGETIWNDEGVLKVAST